MSARQRELLELAYQYTLEHGLVDMSLRPLAYTIGSSPGVLLYSFGSKEKLIRAVSDRARADALTRVFVPSSAYRPLTSAIYDDGPATTT